ncbi:hypothetical protein GF374_03510 [Candidatus Woesearchaeota archaeon]|nr:hypothetical protein [Candidatus Woesearchaeota archaeon]
MFNVLLEQCLFEKLHYLGSCKTIVDLEDEEDVSELAVMVEGGEEITKEEFLGRIKVVHDAVTGESHPTDKLSANPENFEYFYNPNKKIAWYYDINEDVEYFYG